MRCEGFGAGRDCCDEFSIVVVIVAATLVEDIAKRAKGMLGCNGVVGADAGFAV